MREKLIEFIRKADKEDYLSRTQDEHYAAMAGSLIANGVTFAKDINAHSKWIPVSERLPKRNEKVLVCDAREDYVSIWENFDDGLWFGDEITWATEDITHWMPMPEPPKEVE